MESCLDQDFSSEEYEIVVINDGTEDRSMDVVRRYAERHHNIKIIEQKNSGLSVARNIGLEHALGKYVWFVDSDDWIESGILHDLLGSAESNDLDVLCFDFNLAYPDGRRNPWDCGKGCTKEVLSGNEFLCKVCMPPAAWAAIYKRSYLIENDLWFMPGILHEDQEFTPRAYCLARRIQYLPIVAYNYFQREGSIMKSDRSMKRSKDLLVVADSLYMFTNKQTTEGSKLYYNLLNRVYFAFSQSLAHYDGRFSLKEYKSKPYYPFLINIVPDKRLRRKYRLINMSLRLYLIVYRLLKSNV